MGVTAIKPGILTTVQDRGRTGYLGSGFSPSGVMDTRAHASGSQKLWIELSKTEQQRLQPAEQPASDSNR